MCVSRGCQLSDAMHQQRTQIDRYDGLEMSVGSVEDESDISKITTSNLNGCEIEPSPWEPLMHRLIYYLIPIQQQHLDENRDPRLLTLIHDRIMLLLSGLFPEEVPEGIYRSMDSDLEYIVGRYT
eukprot:TRINITY_DN6035_c0_g1_i2.p1 TRINITY_DN6035_c0_g1~~TRINITY_DN6035_c0_g1_i2.p1  ORF type:complete len:125 (-),score=20.40 TRINITY_DN6035_c0_g1_i2:10-384(-)